MKNTPLLLTLVLFLVGVHSLSASPMINISPTLIKPRVEGQQTDVGFGINLRSGYEFNRARWLLSGHAIEWEIGVNGYSFQSGDPQVGDISLSAIPILFNYRFTKYWIESRADTTGMELWSPDFIMYGGAGAGGVVINGDETVNLLTGTSKLEFSEFAPAFQVFFGAGWGFNDHLSLTGGYRHLWMGELESSGYTKTDGSNFKYKSSLHMLDVNLRWLW